MKNPAIVSAARLHRARHRREERQTIVEGPQVVGEAIDAGTAIRAMFGLDDALSHALAQRAGIELSVVSDAVLGKVAGTEHPRGPVAVIEIPPDHVDEARPVLVAWGVGDPGNCGTLVRTAAAFGYGYVSGPESADPWSPKVLRSAAGGHFRTSVASIGAVEQLGVRRLIGTVGSGGDVPGPVGPDAAILVGSEAHGLPDDLIARCDVLVTIPMPGGTESLNAAVAGAIVAYLGAATDPD
jgi:TrmH family RNA methyltransferase